MIFHCLCTLHFVYPFIHQRALELQPLFDLCESCYYEHESTNICKSLLSVLLDIYPEMELIGYRYNYLQFFEEAAYHFSQHLYHLTFLPEYTRFQFLHILINIFYFCFFDNNHSNGCEVVYKYGFDLHFHND